MSVAHVNSGGLGQLQFATSPTSFNLDVGTAANRQAIVLLASTNVSTFTVTAGTDPLSLISGTSGSVSMLGKTFFVRAYGGPLTVMGVQAITATYSGSPDFIDFACEVASGTDLINNGAFTSNGSSPISLGMTSPSGDLCATMSINDGTGAPTSGQTRFYSANVVTGDGADRKTTLSDTDPTHVWTTSGLNWSNGMAWGANFRAAVVAEALEGAMLLS